jgi:hypothetical protein
VPTGEKGQLGTVWSIASTYLADIGEQPDKGLSWIRVFWVAVTGLGTIGFGALTGNGAREWKKGELAVFSVLSLLFLGLFWLTARWAFSGEGWHHVGRVGLRVLLGAAIVAVGGAALRDLTAKSVAALAGVLVSLIALFAVSIPVT